MKLSMMSLLLASIFLLGACGKSDLKSAKRAIKSIQKNKQKEAVTIQDVPTSMQDLINSEFAFTTIYFVAGKGYEVISCDSEAEEDCCYSYFDANGEKLDCSVMLKEDDDDDDDDHYGCGYDDDDWEEELCADIIFPITIVFPDSTTSTVNSYEAYEDEVDVWYDANSNEDDYTFVFPIQVVNEDNDTLSAPNMEELDDLLWDCHDDDECNCDDDDDDDDDTEYEWKKKKKYDQKYVYCDC